MPKVRKKGSKEPKKEVVEIIEEKVEAANLEVQEPLKEKPVILDEIKEEVVIEKEEVKEEKAQVVEKKAVFNPFAKKEEKVVINSGAEKEFPCQVLKTHSCNAFGKTYNLVYGTVVNLPQSVAAMLTERGIIFKK